MNGVAKPEDAIRAAAIALDQNDGRPVIGTDIEGTIVYWNNAATSTYGWPAPEVVGRNILSVTPNYTSADEAAQVMEHLRRGETWSGPFLMQRRDGSPILGRVTDYPVMRRGQVIGVVGITEIDG